jgi:hypothetical protein
MITTRYLPYRVLLSQTSETADASSAQGAKGPVSKFQKIQAGRLSFFALAVTDSLSVIS